MKSKRKFLKLFSLLFCLSFLTGIAFTKSVNAEEITKYVSSSASDNADGSESNPYASIEKAIENMPDGGIISLKDDITLSKTIGITNGQNYTITSSSTNSITRKDNNPFIMIYVGNGSTLTLKNIILDGKNTTVNNADNHLVKVVNSTINIEMGATLKNNNSSWSAGAINLDGSNLNMSGGSITGNNSSYGGGIYASNGNNNTITISGGEISNNKVTSGGGGAINVTGGYAINISGGEFKYNTAENFGGGAFKINNSQLNITGGVISENSADKGDGGAIWLGNVKATIRNVTISNNTSQGKLTGIDYNSTRGGAIFISDGSIVNLENGANLTNNTAPYGGAIYIYDSSKLNITGANISNNTAYLCVCRKWCSDNYNFQWKNN